MFNPAWQEVDHEWFLHTVCRAVEVKIISEFIPGWIKIVISFQRPASPFLG